MDSFTITEVETEEAAASGWTAVGVAAGIGIAALACD